MKEFIARGLDKTYAKEIKEWKKYKKEKIHTKKLTKKMKDEIKKFEKDIKEYSIPELEEIIWDIDPNIPK